MTDFIFLHSFYIGGSAPDNIPALLCWLWSFLLYKPGSLEKAFSVSDIFGEFESRNALNDALEWLYAKNSATIYLATSLVNFLCRLYGFGFLYPKRADLDSTCRLPRFPSCWNRATWRQLTISVWE